MEKEKKYEIFWIVADKKELKAEIHQLGFRDEDSYLEQIDYLTKIHRRNKRKIKIFHEGKTKCIILAGI